MPPLQSFSIVSEDNAVPDFDPSTTKSRRSLCGSKWDWRSDLLRAVAEALTPNKPNQTTMPAPPPRNHRKWCHILPVHHQILACGPGVSPAPPGSSIDCQGYLAHCQKNCGSKPNLGPVHKVKLNKNELGETNSGNEMQANWLELKNNYYNT